MEVRRNGAWGTITHDLDATDAGIVCNSLGYAGAIAIGYSDFGQGSGTVYRHYLCSGNEDSILDCGPGSVYSTSRHSYDGGVICRTQGKSPGGGGVLTPNFGRYVPRQSEKMARAPERAPGRA